MTKKQTAETKIRRLLDSGKSVREVARIVGLGKSTVHEVAHGHTLSDKSRKKVESNLKGVRIPKPKSVKPMKKVMRQPVGSVVVWEPEGDEYKPDPDAVNVSFLRPGERLRGNRRELWGYSGKLGKPLGSRQRESLRQLLEERGMTEKAINDTLYNVDAAKRNDFTDKFAVRRAVQLGTTPRRRRAIVSRAGIQITERYDVEHFIKTGILKEK